LAPRELEEPDYANVLAARMHQKHDELYGFSLPDASSELLGVRVSAYGARPKPELALRANRSGRTPAPKDSRSVYLPSSGEYASVPIFDANQLRTGDFVRGPAVLESETTTILVPDGFAMHCDSLGSCVLTREESS
jgi:N-methylhydantoinase A